MTDLETTLRALIGKTYRTEDREASAMVKSVKAWQSPDGEIKRIYVDLDNPKLIKTLYFPVAGKADATRETGFGPAVAQGHQVTGSSGKKRKHIDEIVTALFGAA